MAVYFDRHGSHHFQRLSLALVAGSQAMQNQETRTDVALYWSAVSLIVCEGLSMEKAARRLGLATRELRDILQRRAQPLNDAQFEEDPGDVLVLPQSTFYDYPPTRPISMS